jgi:hypothetical protein
MSENTEIVEMHGCIVCAKIFNLIAVYTPDGRLVNFSLISSGGQRVQDEQRALVACDTHSSGEIEAAHKRWLSRQEKEIRDEQAEE